MREDPEYSRLQDRKREPRVVVSIVYTVGSIYLTSRSGISNVPGNVLQGCVKSVSSISHTLHPEDGRVTIGSFNFTAVDLAGAISDFIDDQLNAEGEGIRDRRVRVYTGDTDDFDDGTWQQVGEYIVSSEVTWEAGEYHFACTDIQRELRKRLFRPAKTRLTSTLQLTDDVVNVDSTEGFSIVAHTESFTDSPLVPAGYLIFPTGEIARYTDKTATQFKNVTREVHSVGELIEVTPGDDYDRRPEVIEWPYLELPGPQLLYALLTGTVLDTAITLPDTWNLGIATSDVDADSFRNIGADLYDVADPANGGRIFRFIHTEEVDGKSWIEKQLLVPLGCYLAVTHTGKLKLRRITRVLSDASTHVKVQAGRDIIRHSGITHVQRDVINVATIKWNWDGDDHTRVDTHVNAGSIAQHKVAGLREYEFFGLAVTRHTAFTIRDIFDSIVDRFGAPPIEMRCTVSSSFNHIEVGDLVRVVDPGVRNYVTGGTLNHAFEVQSVSINWLTGDVTWELRASSAETLPTQPQQAQNNAIDDAWYESEGAALSSVLTIDATGHVTANGTITGDAADLRASGAIYYYDGDLTIDAGVTVTIHHNVQLRVLGNLTVNGKIDGKGNGDPAISNPDTVSFPATVFPTRQRDVGLGRTQTSDGVFHIPTFGWITNNPGLPQWGHFDAVPRLNLSVDGGVLQGLPKDLRGVRGSWGPSVTSPGQTGTVLAKGGDGGGGGAGLAIILRGTLAFGLNGEIDLSGTDGTAPPGTATVGGVQVYGGAGAGGAPGGLVVLIDKADEAIPDIAGSFIASQGATPQTGTPGTWERPGKLMFDTQPGTGVNAGLGGEDHWQSHHIVMWVPLEVQLGEGAQDEVPAPTITSVSATDAGVLVDIAGVRGLIVEIWSSITGLLADATFVLSGTGAKHHVTLDGVKTRTYFARNRAWARSSAFSAGVLGTGGSPYRVERRIVETFDSYETADDFFREWELLSGTPNVQIVQQGVDGGKVLQVSGAMRAIYRRNIEYDPNLLWEAGARFRRINAQLGHEILSIGTFGVLPDGVTLIGGDGIASTNVTTRNPNRNIVGYYSLEDETIGDWRTAFNWITGSRTTSVGASTGYPGNQNQMVIQPSHVRAQTSTGDQAAYVRPVIECNQPGGTTSICQIDHITLGPIHQPVLALDNIIDPTFALGDDDRYWYIPSGFANISTFVEGAGINGGNAYFFDCNGANGPTVQGPHHRYALNMADQITIWVRYRFGTVTNLTSNPPYFSASLKGYEETSARKVYAPMSGSLPTVNKAMNSALNSDGNWHQVSFVFSAMFADAYLGDAAFFTPWIQIHNLSGSDVFQFYVGRMTVVRA